LFAVRWAEGRLTSCGCDCHMTCRLLTWLVRHHDDMSYEVRQCQQASQAVTGVHSRQLVSRPQ